MEQILETIDQIGKHEVIIIGKYIRIIVDCRQNYGDARALSKKIKTSFNSHDELVDLIKLASSTLNHLGYNTDVYKQALQRAEV